jgi:hypothetical protein
VDDPSPAKGQAHQDDHAAPSEAVPVPPAPSAPLLELLEMVWPETGLQTATRLPQRPKDSLTEDDELQLQIDFLTLSLTPLEFIQLAAFLRMSVDGLLELHPGLQRAVINAFDLR